MSHQSVDSLTLEQQAALQQEKAVRLNLVLDVSLFAPVLTVAVLANSLLLLTDFFEYAKWITGSLISLMILRRIRQGRTEAYEYGPEKIEVLGGAFISCLMLAGMVVMTGVIIGRIIRPEEVVPGFGHVAGVTGIYFTPLDRHEAVWGGWTVYDPTLRGSVSRAKMLMLQKMVIEAHATGRKLLRLYTSTLPAEAAANRLYDHVGLKVYRTEPLPDGTGMVLYRQAELASLYTQAGLDSERQLGTEE